MHRFAPLLLIACLAAAAPLHAAGARHELAGAPVDGLYTPRTDLVKTTLRIEGAELELYTSTRVDVDRLVAGIDRTKSLRAEDIYQRLDAARQELYRDEPLVVVGKPTGAEKAKLVRYFFLWNDVSNAGEPWYTTCPANGSTLAVLFVSLFEGEEDFYVKSSTTAEYKFLGTVDEFGQYQYLTYSQTAKKKTTLGYAWDTIADSTGHIIVYCYL